MDVPEPPPPLPYETPGKLPHASRSGKAFKAPIVPGTFDWNICLRAMLLLMAFVGIMVFVIPRFEDNFRDFKMELPLTTRLLLATSHAMAGGWWIALLAIPPGLGFVVGQFDRLGRALARTLIVVLFGVLVVFVVLGLFSPMMTMIEGMTSTKR
jgi:type II secretory pathway component PulF